MLLGIELGDEPLTLLGVVGFRVGDVARRVRFEGFDIAEAERV